MAENTQQEQTFSQIVEQAARAANIAPDPDPPMTAEEEAIPAAEEAAPKQEEEPAKPEPVVPPPQTVPLAVHIRQREKYEREQSELRKAIEVGNQRLTQIASQLQPQAQTPDETTDPLGATLSKINNLTKDVTETKEILAKRDEQERIRQEIDQFRGAVNRDEQTFASGNPDYPDALQYAKDMKFREYVALGLPHDQAQLRVQQDAFALAQHAFQQGYSPAELAYRMAQALGYKKAEAPAQAQETPAPGSAEQAVEMRAAGASRQKSSGGDGGKSTPISFQELAKLDNDEFAKMTSGKNWERMFKGT